ncbi:alpha-ketoglutarate-dependent dioxygenase AlkB family protein [Xanthomonas sacchari]|uniref:alpha-ketoglutarate-dependent dioxygenase AlkB family protein n=1 Tax=Xanthomonas sacchari TaxID=56458 RepID=UPI002255EAA2|nr:alpha-ketoglutarate-dependent dioxygenase AlkB [Xanthomonas sacchari]
MSDLFESKNGSIHLPVEGAEILLIKDFLTETNASMLFETLLAGTNWRQESVVVWGKSHQQPRLVAWMGDHSYTYSGLLLRPEPWAEDLKSVKAKIELEAGSNFNSALLNLYRNGLDRMAAHSDDEVELGPRPIIASLSLGATRRIRFLPKNKNSIYKTFSLDLPNGCLLIMKGETQKNWLHEIPKESKLINPRINITFRKVRP